MRLARGILICLMFGAGPALAETSVAASLRPEARPLPVAPLRPVARAPAQGDTDADIPGAAGPAAAMPPPVRPASLAGAAVPPDAAPDMSVTVAAMARARRAEAALIPPAVDLITPAFWSGPVPPGRPRTGPLAPADPGANAHPALRPALRPDRPTPPPIPTQTPTGAISFDGPASLPMAAIATDPGFSDLAISRALRPATRPARIVQAAVRLREERARGAICGSPAIQGDVLGRVDGPGACGVEAAVRVRSVAGVRLSSPAVMDCTTAQALHRWMERGAIPAVAGTGGGLNRITVVSHYACRGRNNQPGARLSEHAYGRAIDIAGFGLRDGSSFTVLRGWGSRAHGGILRAMHRAACGPFGTVLGPEANRFHRDHFHFDTARHRSGSYCR